MRGVLFDLDGTLLDIRLGEFLRDYFGALARIAHGRYGGMDIVEAISASTEAMMLSHPGLTNQEAFDADFLARTGVDMRVERPFFDRFYDEEFPLLASDSSAAKGARLAVETALELGLGVAIATNPIFPMTAIRHRLAWAGLDDLDLPVVTSYELMHATKPLGAYYRETASLLGLEPRECLMVGDDPALDLPAADVGMRTFYVGDGTAAADFRGDLEDLAALLPRLVTGD